MAQADMELHRAVENWMSFRRETTEQKANQWRLAKKVEHRQALQSSRILAPAARASLPQVVVAQAWACRTEQGMAQAWMACRIQPVMG